MIQSEKQLSPTGQPFDVSQRVESGCGCVGCAFLMGQLLLELALLLTKRKLRKSKKTNL